VLEFLCEANLILPDCEPGCSVNMDETPFYMDINHNKTIERIGKKSIDIVNTGNHKTRFTVVVTITASGKMLPLFVIFKGIRIVLFENFYIIV
jgi:hypothetical protein